MKDKLLSIENKLKSGKPFQRMELLVEIKKNLPKPEGSEDTSKGKQKNKKQRAALKKKYPNIARILKQYNLGWFAIPHKSLMNIKDLTPAEGQFLAEGFMRLMVENMSSWGLKDVMSKMEVTARYTG